MNCPFCGAGDTKVIDSRPADNNSIRRRRECEGCGKRFTTYEKIETLPLMVRKKNDMRVAYDRKKLTDGILAACHKRPISALEIETMIDHIEAQIFAKEDREISTNEIGELVMANLKELDDVAYVRFASVYREFKDVDSFLEEISKLAKRK